uniref:hypothetical protein n=1 Tax=Serratia marcescens TaxID=615 RepID=UPI0013DB3608
EEAHRSKQSEISSLVSEDATLAARLAETERALSRFLLDSGRLETERDRLQASEKDARAKIFAFETERGALE